MKKILLIALLSVLLPFKAAFADACATSYMPVFTPQQSAQICSKNNSWVSAGIFETVAAAGSAQGDAAALSSSKFTHQVTGADGTKGVILPTAGSATIGRVHEILNTTAAVLKIYPATGGAINGGSANAALSALAGIHTIVCIQTAALTWVCA